MIRDAMTNHAKLRLANMKMAKPGHALGQFLFKVFTIQRHNGSVEVEPKSGMIDRLDKSSSFGRRANEVAAIDCRVRLKAKRNAVFSGSLSDTSEEFDGNLESLIFRQITATAVCRRAKDQHAGAQFFRNTNHAAQIMKC